MLRKIRKVFSGEHRKEKGNPSAKTLANKEQNQAECLHHLGYLADRDKGTPIPPECISCLEVLKCIEFNLT